MPEEAAGITERLERLHYLAPSHDRRAAEAAIARHLRTIGLWPLPVTWCSTMDEAWKLIGRADEEDSTIWDFFENRISGGDPELWPRPDPLRPGNMWRECFPFLRALYAGWRDEESTLMGVLLEGRWGSFLGISPGRWEKEEFDALVPTRSPALAAALLAGPGTFSAGDRAALLALLEAAEAGLWLFWIVKREFFALARPGIRCDQGRLHDAQGPAVFWPDGRRWHFWRGVRVPEHVVERPQEITAEEILTERDVEVRRIMLDRFGPARFIEDSGARIVHQDRFGVLYRIDLREDEPLVMVKVVNSTPEPDGLRKNYFLRVPPGMRTAREAVAWTFGLGPRRYRPYLET